LPVVSIGQTQYTKLTVNDVAGKLFVLHDDVKARIVHQFDKSYAEDPGVGDKVKAVVNFEVERNQKGKFFFDIESKQIVRRSPDGQSYKVKGMRFRINYVFVSIDKSVKDMILYSVHLEDNNSSFENLAATNCVRIYDNLSDTYGYKAMHICRVQQYVADFAAQLKLTKGMPLYKCIDWVCFDLDSAEAANFMHDWRNL